MYYLQTGKLSNAVFILGSVTFSKYQKLKIGPNTVFNCTVMCNIV